ncbi:hypothetical protein HPB50_015959 [Hyalomma asiaticum]|uniref:Uncharacterized protein n=1 Tax=Hyalomma asiaticum TaxID=266040 RepID=A0ACB7TJA2_HYAAI|nr:hypothetical protein HPB50_015959 [Hyalomma asiaticum]
MRQREDLLFSKACHATKPGFLNVHIIKYITELEVSCLGVLTLGAQKTKGHTTSVQRTNAYTTHVFRLVSGISTRSAGIKESSSIRLAQAVVISRTAYYAPFSNFTHAEKHLIDIIARKAFKEALHLRPSTADEKNIKPRNTQSTQDEVIQAQRTPHYERLSRTKIGRTVLKKLVIQYHKRIEENRAIPPDIRNTSLHS